MTRLPGLRASPERTLESLYERHAAEVYRYALVMLESATDAEDVTQTTFLNAYRALVRGERPRASGSWLRVIAHNLCLQHFRQAARRPREVELEEDTAPAPEPDGIAAGDLLRALGQVPVNQRTALVMRELEGRSIAEIADVLSVSSSAVETLLFRARRSVREQLESGITCDQAEQAISRQLDGALPRAERAQLRGHLRQCDSCAHLARGLRAQRRAMKSLAVLPLPAALAWSKFGTGPALSAVAGGAAAGTGGSAGAMAALTASLGGKLAAVTLLAGALAGAGYEVAVHHPGSASRPAAGRRPSLSASTAAGQAGSATVRPVAAALPADAGTSAGRVFIAGHTKGAPGTIRRPGHARAAAGAGIRGVSAPGASGSHAGEDPSGGHRRAPSRGVSSSAPGHLLHPQHPVHPARPAPSARRPHPTRVSRPAGDGRPASAGHSAGSTHTTHVRHTSQTVQRTVPVPPAHPTRPARTLHSGETTLSTGTTGQPSTTLNGGK